MNNRQSIVVVWPKLLIAQVYSRMYLYCDRFDIRSSGMINSLDKDRM